MVQPDTIIEATMQEYVQLRGSEEYEDVDPADLKNKDPLLLRLAVSLEKGVCLPSSKTEHFNLTALNWKDDSIYRMIARYSKPTLLAILRAMKSVGVPVVAHPDWLKNDLEDAVASAGIRAGWIKDPAPLHEKVAAAA